MRLPEWLARFNRYVTNPIQRLWADRLAPWAVIAHRGRVTGRHHRTPVLAFPTGAGFAVILFYGPDTDWVRNLEAAGGGVVVRRGRRWWVGPPEVVRGEAGQALLPWPMRWIVRALGHPPVLHLRARAEE